MYKRKHSKLHVGHWILQKRCCCCITQKIRHFHSFVNTIYYSLSLQQVNRSVSDFYSIHSLKLHQAAQWKHFIIHKFKTIFKLVYNQWISNSKALLIQRGKQQARVQKSLINDVWGIGNQGWLLSARDTLASSFGSIDIFKTIWWHKHPEQTFSSDMYITICYW